MARNLFSALTLFGIFAAWAFQAGSAFGQLPQGGATGNGTGALSPADLRTLMTNPFYARARQHKGVQSGVNPAAQQDAQTQQQLLMEQQRAAEKAKKREADRERKQAAAKTKRAKELEEREQKRQERAGGAVVPEKKK